MLFRMPDRLASELTAVHGFARRLVVVNLTDQLALRFTEGSRQVPVVGDRYSRWKTGQGRTERHALLLTAAILYRDFDVHLIGIPPFQVRPERHQRLQNVRALLLFKTRTQMYSALVENVSSLVVSSTHLASSPDSHFDGRPRLAPVVRSSFPCTLLDGRGAPVQLVQPRSHNPESGRRRGHVLATLGHELQIAPVKYCDVFLQLDDDSRG